ncbi:hypothetical protein [Moorena bouillonii]|uniref:Uncharacterized protein n=1 Tax=Moorena bouillonii PNG TaxID=568701 RepID=A0A1U7MX01_9CYAN|nr:hypothetical protein [Moorena bouillonii]OLT58236.1 hypothetical protein BJP37_03410 [Moorena bouillonii PNG]
MKEKILINDLETRPSQETDLLKLLEKDDQKKVKGGSPVVDLSRCQFEVIKEGYSVVRGRRVRVVAVRFIC